MANKFSIKYAESPVKFPFAVVKQVEEDLCNATKKGQSEAISRILRNNNIQHSVLHDMVVVHDLRIMDECCDFAWYMNIAAIAAIQMTSEIAARIITCPFPTIIQQEGIEIFPVYTADSRIIVMEKVFDNLPDTNGMEYQIIRLSSDARFLGESVFLKNIDVLNP